MQEPQPGVRARDLTVEERRLVDEWATLMRSGRMPVLDRGEALELAGRLARLDDLPVDLLDCNVGGQSVRAVLATLTLEAHELDAARGRWARRQARILEAERLEMRRAAAGTTSAEWRRHYDREAARFARLRDHASTAAGTVARPACRPRGAGRPARRAAAGSATSGADPGEPDEDDDALDVAVAAGDPAVGDAAVARAFERILRRDGRGWTVGGGATR